MIIDLHTHTIASDGELTPTQLIKKARQLGLTYLAKTDHDTVNLTDEFLTAAKKYNIKPIPGIEISSQYKGESVHIVGLNINYHNKKIIQYTKTYTRIRQSRATKIINKLKKLGWYIDTNQLQRSLIGRPHMALAVIKHPKNAIRLKKEFTTIPTFSEFINKYITPGGTAYVARSKHLNITATINLIHQAGGLAILAHPYAKKNEIKQFNKFIKNLTKLNFDALEVYSPKHTPTDIKQLLILAQKNNLLISGGSDYHNTDNKLGHYGRHVLTSKLCQNLINTLDR